LINLVGDRALFRAIIAADYLTRGVTGSWLEEKFQIANSDAANDVAPSSPVIAALNVVDTVPHVSLHGDIDKRFAWLKVAASARGADGSVLTSRLQRYSPPAPSFPLLSSAIGTGLRDVSERGMRW
jgi:hypothetical protein